MEITGTPYRPIDINSELYVTFRTCRQVIYGYSMSTSCSTLTCLDAPMWCCCPSPMESLLKGIIFMVVSFMEYQRVFHVAQMMPLS